MPIFPSSIQLPPNLFSVLGQGNGGGLLHADGTLRFVTLVELKCVETEDWTGPDETYLSIYIHELQNQVESAALGAVRDVVTAPAFGGLVLQMPATANPFKWGWKHDGDPTLNNGQRADINITLPLPVGASVVVKCFDADGDFPGDDDDYLGNVSISAAFEPRQHVCDIKGDGAHYKLTFDVHAVKLLAPPVPPPPPVLAGVPGVSEASLSWADVSGAQNYELFRNGSRIQTLGAGTRSFKDTGLKALQVYEYQLRATNGAGPGAFSNKVPITPLPEPMISTNPDVILPDGLPIKEGVDLIDAARNAAIAAQRKPKTGLRLPRVPDLPR